MDNIDFEHELNPDQYAAVTSPPDRPALVLAGAGSGKTRTLTYRVAWLIEACGISPHEILLLTFTNKAAAQMLSRIESLTGRSARSFWGGTFHSLGNRFLRIEGESIGVSPNFTILDSEDSDKLLKKTVEDRFPKFFSNKDNPRSKLLREIVSYARNTRVSIQSAMAYRFNWIETPAAQIEEIASAYEAEKRASNSCDFDDLLELWYKILAENPAILKKYRERFKNILVDEYQDTNKLQSDILDLLAEKGNLSAVGDDAQCIYSWRGAEIDNILCFRERYPAAYIHKIERNYRSSAQILKFANQILDRMPFDYAEYRKVLVPAREGICKPRVVCSIDGASQGRKIAQMISEIDMGGKYGLDDIAVLYRSHFQAMDLQLQLQYAKIPFVMTSGVKFFEQAHVKDIVAQIKFADNPQDKMSFLRFCRFMPKIGDKTAFKIFDKLTETAALKGVPVWRAMGDKKVLAKVPSAAKQIFEAAAADIEKLGELVARCNKSRAEKKAENIPEQTDFFADMAHSANRETASVGGGKPPASVPFAESVTESEASPKSIIKCACGGWYKDMMKTIYEDWETRAEDFDSLFEYASKFEDFDDFLASVTLEINEAEGNAGESAGRVRLMTVHQAKGLEFPVVFVIGAADGLFPTQRSIDDGDVDEERRLFYVASTRAMDFLVLSYPRVSAVGGNFEMRKPSRFLEDIDASCYDVEY